MQGIIIGNISNTYKIKTETKIYEAFARGKFKNEEITPLVGDKVEIIYNEETFEGLLAEDIKLDVVFEDDSILVINKPCGMVVHPCAGNYTGTVVNALLYRYGDDFKTLEEDDSDLRPGIVHRLDKDTSGLLLIAKTRDAHKNLGLNGGSKAEVTIAT